MNNQEKFNSIAKKHLGDDVFNGMMSYHGSGNGKQLILTALIWNFFINNVEGEEVEYIRGIAKTLHTTGEFQY